MAMQSVFTNTAYAPSWDTKYLPLLSALYESLIDDDDEVREAAALAASSLMGVTAVAPTAADGLVPWLRERFAESEEFGARVVCRMVGQPYPAGELRLVPAEVQLGKAMEFDDSLFAAEDQNLFVDEVREAVRWRGALGGSGGGETPSASVGCLRDWAEAGLRCLIGLLAEREDGPLGWTSDQHVFAVCARVLVCAGAVAGMEEKTGAVGELLHEFGAVGAKRGIHGSLLAMAGVDAVA